MTEPEPCAESERPQPRCDECWTGDDRPCYRCSECIAYALAAARNDGDDTELRAIFGEPVEGRDFTRIDGSRRGTEAAP